MVHYIKKRNSMKRILSFALFLTLTLSSFAHASSQITVITIQGCSKCAYLVNYLKNNKIQFTEITSEDPEHGKKLWQALQSTGTYKGGTVYGPTVIINGKTYYSIKDLEGFASSIPSLLAAGAGDKSSSRDQDTISVATDSQFTKNITERHNYYRQNHNTAPLKWNESIQKYAQEWADKLAAEDRMYHRQPNSYGENIYWTSGGEVNGNTPVDSWYAEIKSYNYSSPGFSSSTGHFTQVVWAGSTEIGCGKAKSKRGGTFIVCNYNPPGNYQGRFPKNVLPQKSTGGNSGTSNNNSDIVTLSFSNGSKYTGQVKNGKMEGQGTLTFQNGSVYTGSMQNGLMHGKGTMTYSNGDRYTGEWKNNMKDGFGTYTWVSGSWYKGYYKNGKYNGQGSLYSTKTGKVQTGSFVDGKFSGN